MKTSLFFRFLLVALMAFTVAGTAQAESLRQRMQMRLPALDALKARGVVGENNQGFVEVRGEGGDEAARLVAAENHDRAQVFAHIAEKNGTTAEDVGHLRAKKIAENSKPGVWLQAPDGTWYQKKG